jgi:hypothetical protein
MKEAFPSQYMSSTCDWKISGILIPFLQENQDMDGFLDYF